MEVWCSGLTRCPVKAETAGSNPVTSASPNFPLTGHLVKGEERGEFGSRLHGRDPFVFHDDLLEQQPRQPVPLLLRRPLPALGDVCQQHGQPGEVRARVVFPRVQRRQFPLQPLPLRQVLLLRQIAQEVEIAQPGQFRSWAAANRSRPITAECRAGANPSARSPGSSPRWKRFYSIVRTLSLLNGLGVPRAPVVR